MKITGLVWFKVFPPKFGGQKGIVRLQEQLTKHFDVSCICSSDNEIPSVTPLRILPVLKPGKWQFIDPFSLIRCYKAIAREKTDVLILEHPYHALVGLIAKRFLKVKLVLHEHNIEHLRFREIGKWWWRPLKVIEKWISRKSDLIFYKTASDRDQAIALFKLDPSKCHIIPYGIDARFLNTSSKEKITSRHHIDQDSKLPLFAGTLDYEPNAKTVENIYKHLAPLLSARDPHSRILICGRNKFKNFAYLNQFRHENVLMVGEVENVREYFEAADVFIAPVLNGGGIQTKILDALGFHINVVAFERSLKGIDLTGLSGKIHVIKDGDWNSFADLVIEASQNKPETSLDYLLKYSWTALGDRAADLIRKL